MVYPARDLKYERLVALKVLRPELAAVLGAERFLREIRLTAQLQHPHILTLIDSGDADGFLYYVMPYVEGESLRHRLAREGQLPLDEALSHARAIASALDFAHARGVIHRDIKPENVMLHQGEPMVADFGIALAVSTAGHGRLTETGITLGTPAYMSPEQASGERTVDGRSDQYSLACVVYEMLAGEPPYAGPTAQSILAKRLTEPIPHLRALRALGTARTGAYFSLAPFVGAVASVIVWREPVTLPLALAAALMGLGVWLHLTERHQHEHIHDSMEHDHLHVHDEHHRHTHTPEDPLGEPHSHPHRHEPLVHTHPHYPDIHHRHSHE